jgi:diguanylate cyclase (GGDEF)-like protein/PAS domain S-box-containing protein
MISLVENEDKDAAVVRFRAIIEASPDCIAVIDAGGRLRDINPAGACMLGAVAPDEMLGRHWTDFLASEDRDGFTRIHERVLAGEEGGLEFRTANRKDDTRWLSMRAVPLRDGDGRITGLLGLTRDITAQRDAESALRESEERYALAIRGSNDGIWDWNPPSGEVYVSPRLEALLGFSEGETEQTFDFFDSRLHPDDADHNREVLLRHLNDREPYDVEFRLRTRDGGYRWFRSRGQALWDESGQAVRMAGAITDIHERKLVDSVARDRLIRASRQRQALIQLTADEQLGDVPLEQILQHLTEVVARTLDVDRAGIWLLEENDTCLRCIECYLLAHDQHVSGMVVRRHDHPRYFEALNGSRGIAVRDASTDPRTAELNAGYLQQHRITSLVDAPIRIGGRIVGVVSCEHGGDPRFWAEDEVSFVASVGDHAANVMVNEERRRALRELSETDALYRATFAHTAVGMAHLSLDGFFVHVNERLANMLGYLPDELKGMHFREVTHPEDMNIDLDSVRGLIGGEIPGYVVKKRYIHRQGTTVWVNLGVSLLRDADGEPQAFVTVLQDITVEQAMSEELSYQARHDSLTGLFSRTEFEKQLSRLLQSTQNAGKHHAFCYLDLDQFKVINDTCGHIAGDELLRRLGPILSGEIREQDIIARLGGDEFGVLLEGCSVPVAEKIADKLRRAVSDFRFQWESQVFSLGVSIGLVPIDATSESVAAVLSAADAACYEAKDAGRNRIHVYHRADSLVPRRMGEMRWVAEINLALEKDRFDLYCQPMFPMHEGVPGGLQYELLLRLHLPDGKIVPPGAFLPAAERYGLAVRIDTWVIYTYWKWIEQNPSHLERLGQCSINLSGASLADPGFLAFTLETVRSGIVPPEKICFEITETIAISRLSEAAHFISELRKIGCVFALDDFGTGMSSFAYLKTLPVQYLKIDGLFVRDVVDDPVDCAVVRSINDIGHELGMMTVAEFVENEAIFARLKTLGVDYGQGFHFCRPLPLGECEAFVD